MRIRPLRVEPNLRRSSNIQPVLGESLPHYMARKISRVNPATRWTSINCRHRSPESGLNDREIVLEALRSTQLINMLHEFIHQVALLTRRHGQVGYTRIEIPGVTSISEDFKHTIAENQQPTTDGDLTRLS